MSTAEAQTRRIIKMTVTLLYLPMLKSLGYFSTFSVFPLFQFLLLPSSQVALEFHRGCKTYALSLIGKMIFSWFLVQIPNLLH